MITCYFSPKDIAANAKFVVAEANDALKPRGFTAEQEHACVIHRNNMWENGYRPITYRRLNANVFEQISR